MLVTYEPEEYAGTAEKHKTRKGDLEKALSIVDDVPLFNADDRPMKRGRENGVHTAGDALYSSVHRSRYLWHRAVAADIALDMDYQADEMQMRQDGEHLQEVILWEPSPEGKLADKLDDSEALTLVETEKIDDDIVYTCECNFSGYHHGDIGW